MAKGNDKFITTSEAGKMLGLKSLSAVRAWWTKGIIGGYQCEKTGTIRIDRQSVLDFLADHTTGACSGD